MKGYKVNMEKKSVKKKVEQIESIKADIKGYKTVAILDLRKLPDSLLQGIRKKLRNEGKIIVAKKPVLERVLKSDKLLSKYAADADKPLALILTNLSPIALSMFLKENRKKRAAKVGEPAPFEIVVPEGDTDIPPGPALSELKGAGLNVQIKGGKIVIAKDSVLAKVGETLTDPKVKALQKLSIMPFEVMARLMLATDKEYVYKSELLDIGDTLNADMQHCVRDAFNLSVNASYPTANNASMLLQEAVRQGMNVSINAGLYSSSTMEQLLSSALRQGMALGSLGK